MTKKKKAIMAIVIIAIAALAVAAYHFLRSGGGSGYEGAVFVQKVSDLTGSGRRQILRGRGGAADYGL